MAKTILISDDDSSGDAVPDGGAKGLVQRDFRAHPLGSFEYAAELPDNLIIPRGEWSDRLNLQKKFQSRIIDVRNRGMDGKPIPSRDQNGRGYCWFHSGTTCMMLARAAQNEPYADLSAYAGACIIKNYRDEGGFGAQGLKFQAERGIPTSEFWPQQSTSKKNDNPKTWENAAKHKWSKWYDLEPRNIDHFVTACLMGWPIISDFNWWGHSVGTMCLEEVGNDWSKIVSWILNSWGDKWSQNGAGLLKGKKAAPDSMQCCVVTYASAA
jgi:hypothetical protein